MTTFDKCAVAATRYRRSRFLPASTSERRQVGQLFRKTTQRMAQYRDVHRGLRSDRGVRAEVDRESEQAGWRDLGESPGKPANGRGHRGADLRVTRVMRGGAWL